MTLGVCGKIPADQETLLAECPVQEGGGQHVGFFVLRCVIVALALWVLWRLCTALFHARRPPRLQRQQDEWAEVLEQIEALPETTDPHPRT